VPARTVLCVTDSAYSCYSVATGRQVWSANLHDAVADSTLMYAQTTPGAPIVAQEPASRRVVWSYPLPTGFVLGQMCSPVGGLLIPADKTQTVIALDAPTGRQAWIYH
jgi:glucose dehydrogenase